MNFWSKKNVLLTGASGFIGNRLFQSLIKKNARVFCFVRDRKRVKIESKKLFEKSKSKIYEGEITDKEKISRIITNNNIDHIFHLAANNQNRVIDKESGIILKANITGSVSLLDACIEKENLKSIILVSSKEVKSNRYLELDKVNKHPYAISKLCIELIANSYIENFNLPVLIVKFDNIYGESDLNFNRLIPSLCKNMILGKKVSINNNVNVYKGFIYIDDIVRALELTVENSSEILSKDHVYFNSKNLYSIKGVYNLVSHMINKEKKNHSTKNITKDNIDFKNNAFFWKANTNFENGLKRTINWYKEFLKVI